MMTDKLKTITIRELSRGSAGSLTVKLPAKLTKDGEVIAVILPVHIYNKLVNDFSLSHNTHGQPVAQAKIPQIPGLVMQGNRIVGVRHNAENVRDPAPSFSKARQVGIRRPTGGVGHRGGH